jgi:hypothetical protein
MRCIASARRCFGKLVRDKRLYPVYKQRMNLAPASFYFWFYDDPLPLAEVGVRSQ